jgi:hypothetical protein
MFALDPCRCRRQKQITTARAQKNRAQRSPSGCTNQLGGCIYCCTQHDFRVNPLSVHRKYPFLQAICKRAVTPRESDYKRKCAPTNAPAAPRHRKTITHSISMHHHIRNASLDVRLRFARRARARVQDDRVHLKRASWKIETESRL